MFTVGGFVLNEVIIVIDMVNVILIININLSSNVIGLIGLVIPTNWLAVM